MIPRDIPFVGGILHEAFNRVFADHGYPPPIPDASSGEALARAYHDYESEGCFVALAGGEIAGSAFLHRRGERAGVGPVTVAPHLQGQGVGRRLMLRVLDEAAACSSMRLYQDAFNRQSFGLYVSLGFEVRGVMAILRAEPAGLLDFAPAVGPTPMFSSDLAAVSACDTLLTGLDRPHDLAFLRGRGPSRILKSGRAVTGYAVSFLAGDTLFLGPAAAPDVAGLLDLVTSVVEEAGADVVTMRAPAQPGALMAGLLGSGFAVRSLGNYMVRGRYEDPKGVFLSALFPETL